ncbi:uncharacterized protein DS421_5g154530 [Arachis hypogaea]|nr:uncharacterized protein DS421_5g154530 [Arachis hypogaea]
MRTGSVAPATGVEGVKSRNQTSFAASTVTSSEVTPLLGRGLGLVLWSRNLRRRRLMVPSERHATSFRAANKEMENRMCHASDSFGVSELPSAAILCIIF